MQYNPHTSELFTNEGDLIKRFHCPIAKQWDTLIQTDFLKGKTCGDCQQRVLDTALFTDNELYEQVTTNPHTCLKVDLNQNNLTITYDTNEE